MPSLSSSLSFVHAPSLSSLYFFLPLFVCLPLFHSVFSVSSHIFNFCLSLRTGEQESLKSINALCETGTSLLRKVFLYIIYLNSTICHSLDLCLGLLQCLACKLISTKDEYLSCSTVRVSAYMHTYLHTHAHKQSEIHSYKYTDVH